MSPPREDEFKRPATPKPKKTLTLSNSSASKVSDPKSKSSAPKLPPAKKPRTMPKSPPPKPKKVRSLSDSSSSEEENEEKEDEQTKFKKLMEMKEVPKNITAPIGVKAQSNIKLLKESFEDNNFDEAMQKYAQMKKALIPPAKMPPPLIIPPPQTDPSQKRGKKRKLPQEETRPDAHLGGIFTINNGWDEPIPKKEPPKMIPREQRFLPPITLVNPGLLHDHDAYMEELKGMAGSPVIPDDDDEIGIKRTKFHRSIFDSDDDDEESEKENQNVELEAKTTTPIDELGAKDAVAENYEPNVDDFKHSGDSGCDDSELMLYDDE